MTCRRERRRDRGSSSASSAAAAWARSTPSMHEEIGKRAALKVMHRRLVTTGVSAERILLEARVVNQVGHPNIVDIFETGTLRRRPPVHRDGAARRRAARATAPTRARSSRIR